MPLLISIIAGTTIQRDEVSVTLERMSSPVAENIRPPTVKGRHPKRSESTPLTDPSTAMQSALGTTTRPAVLGL